jgi:hypothetical protein
MGEQVRLIVITILGAGVVGLLLLLRSCGLGWEQ